MCIYKVFRFVGCGEAHDKPHNILRVIRCSRPFLCKQPSATVELCHAGECPLCLRGGPVFPLASYHVRTNTVQPSTHPLIIEQCKDLAQYLLDWSVLWLSGFWGQPEPLGLDPNVQVFIDKVALLHHYCSVSCVECGNSRGLAAFTDDPGPCATCPSVLARAPGTGTTSLAILLQTQIARAAYNNRYLTEVKAGKHYDLMASIVVAPAVTPPALTSTEAGMLVNRRWPAIDLIQNEQRLLDGIIPGLIQHLRKVYESPSTPRASPLEKAEWHRFTNIAEKILNVASWVLAADTGLHLRHKQLTLHYLSTVLIHPRCPVVPLPLVPFHGPNGCAPVTHEAILGYLRLPDPEGTIDRMTVGFRDVYTQIQSRRAAEVAVRKHTKESMVKARLTYHTEALSQPSDDSWMCCICHEKDNVNLIRLACGHELHYDCMKDAGVFGQAPNTTRCPYCRQSWDKITDMYDIEETTLNQEAPWNEYDLAGVGEPGLR